MNDSDLDAQLQALRTPERGEEYWEDFPGRVTRELHNRTLPQPVRSSWLPQLAWGFSLAFGCFALGFFLGHNNVSKGITHAWMENQKEARMSLFNFPEQFRSLMLHEHNLQVLVPEQPEGLIINEDTNKN